MIHTFTALLPSGSIVHSEEYDDKVHGLELYCIDPACKAPVIHVGRSERSKAYFKTVGRDEDSKHKRDCGFYEPLDVIQAIEKTPEYQKKVLESVWVPKKIIRLNMNRLDPEYQAKERDPKEETEKDNEKLGIREQRDQPDVISSMKSIIKLLTTNEPDVLSTIYFGVNGRRLPMSNVVMGPRKAHDLLWSDQSLRINYFVYGKILNITTLEKVTYLDLESDSDHPLTLVVFKEYYRNFTKNKFEDLLNRDILVYGQLRKNDYNDKRKCEIIIKTEKYIALFKRNLSTIEAS